MQSIIINPPYSGTLCIDFLNRLLNYNLYDRINIVLPSSFLVDLREPKENGRTNVEKYFVPLKDRLDGHVKKVIIENLNKEFEIAEFHPLAILEIYPNEHFDVIEFTCFGYTTFVSSLYDCNLIGCNYLYRSIMTKVQANSKFQTMKMHEYHNQLLDRMYYTKFADMCGCTGCSMSTPKNGLTYSSDALYLGDYMKSYYAVGYHTSFNSIEDYPLHSVKRGAVNGALSDKVASCLFGTKSELENWKHFVFNNKLYLFISMSLVINQHNFIKEYMPWVVDKEYTDEELNNIFGFTQEEIDFMTFTTEKFKRNSPWFKRYACGPSVVSDQEVSDFITDLKKKYNQC